MKTIKTTLIVIATVVAVYLVYDLVTGSTSYYEASSNESKALSDELDHRTALQDLGEKYKGKSVTIMVKGASEVPFWQIYRKNKVGSFLHGDKVTLLAIDLYHSEGYNAKIRTQDGLEGFVTLSNITELNE